MNETIRHEKLLAQLAIKRMLSIPEIVQFLNISPATARRDVNKLHQQGKLIKVRNGVEHKIRTEIGLELEEKKNHIKHFSEKQRIAVKAASLCKPDENVILTCGSTMLLLGEQLCQQKVQIITNYLPLANYLIEHNHPRVVIMGGQYNQSQAITLSMNADSETFAADIMFTSGKGLTDKGLYKTDMLIANSEQRILSKNQKLIVLLDSSKLGKAVGMLFTSLDNIHLLITGHEADPAIIKQLEAKGLNILLA